MKEYSMDETDVLLLEELKADARKTVNELAARLGIPRSTVHERITRLRERGVIKKFTIEEDYSKTGIPTVAFILAAYDPSSHIKQREVAKEIATIPGVFSVHIISGEWDMLIKVRGKTIEDIGNLIVDRVRQTKGLAKTYTMSCFDAIKD